MIIVVNKYIDGEEGEYIGRPSPLGNPFTVEKYGREEAIRRYRSYLETQIKFKGRKVCEELNRLYKIAKAGDLRLVCFCKPQACHGDVIKEILESKLKVE